MPSLPPVIHEDEDIIAFDKPSGMLVAPDRWDKNRENLMGLVHAKLGKEVSNVHRIDAVTSGLLLCARNHLALVALSGQWEGRAVRKRYLALVAGRPIPADSAGHDSFPADAPEGSWIIDLPIGEDARQPGRMRVSHASGKKSETLVRILEYFRGHTLLECEPLTGRTHQLRVHLAATGTPIVADPFYGGAPGLMLSQLKPRYKAKKDEPEKPLIGRCALHAAGILCRHPRSGEPLALEAPIPDDFAVALKYLRRYSADAPVL